MSDCESLSANAEIEEYISPEAAAIPNLDLVKNMIRAYYGDHLDADGRHQFSFTSAWATDVATVIQRAKQYLLDRAAEDVSKPALVLDVDDTALCTYPYLANTEFGSRKNREILPAIPQTLDLARFAHSRGVSIFYLSVRPADRREDTLANLACVGFPTPAGLFLRTRTPPFPPYLGSPSCPPDEFKSCTRAYIQSQGYHILAAIGDQESDVRGGFADKVFKLPNPMYHTP